MTEDQARAYVEQRTGSKGIERLELLGALLAEENQRQNLVAQSSLELLWSRHIADSVQLADHVSRETGAWLDLGSGAGFPGLVLAAIRPEAHLHLVESRRKRVEWLGFAAERMGLKNCTIHRSRLELLQPFSADVITARAFAPLEKLLRLSAAFSTTHTDWVLPKGRSAAQELAALPNDLHEMFHVEQSVTDDEAAILVGRGSIPVSWVKGANR